MRVWAAHYPVLAATAWLSRWRVTSKLQPDAAMLFESACKAETCMACYCTQAMD